MSQSQSSTQPENRQICSRTVASPEGRNASPTELPLDLLSSNTSHLNSSKAWPQQLLTPSTRVMLQSPDMVNMDSEFILFVRMLETSLTETGEDPTNNCIRLSGLGVTQWLFFLLLLIVNSYSLVWYFPSLAFSHPPRILLHEMTGRRILPLLSTQTPPSLSGEPYNNCRCTGPAPAALGSHKAVHCTALCSVCVGFWASLGPFFPVFLHTLQQLRMPTFPKGNLRLPGFFRKKKQSL